MKLSGLIDLAKNGPIQTIAVAHAEDIEVLKAVKHATEHKIARFILFGNHSKLQLMLEQLSLSISSDWVDVIHSETTEDSAEQAVKSVRNQNAEVLMKGNLPTSTLLNAVLNKEYGLRTKYLLSHVAVFEVKGYDRLLFVTDAAMNLKPDLPELEQIVTNAVKVARDLDVDSPKVAALAAVETVNPKMEATIHAASLAQMNRRGQIKDCLIDGPLAIDNAVSALSAEHKQLTGDVPGNADILLVPTIEAGNILYKSLIYFAGAKVSAIIAGARAPIVLTSRSDSFESKLNSIALALCTKKDESF